ncbi:MAG: AAA family ATPase [Hyphomonadaceae bacterium]
MSLTVAECAFTGYRSLRRIRFPLRRLNVFVGDNGVGKTNLYHALQMVQAAAAGTLGRALAAEGGLQSASWAGERKKGEKAGLVFEAKLGDRGEHAYEVTVGFRACTEAAFELEPIIRAETLTFHGAGRPEVLLERRNQRAWARDEAGVRQDVEADLLPSETALAELKDSARFPDIDLVRRALLQWRFYHGFRTDADSPLRRPCLAVTTPTLASDGGDLAAVFATLAHIRQDTKDLDETVADAFPGARLIVPEPGRSASFAVNFADFPKREFSAAEVSDGTLRFLALAGALLGYRLPPFLALNEPETSLHPDLLPALARLIARAAERSQVWVVTHSAKLAAALEEEAGARPIVVIKRDGQTWLEGLTSFGEFHDDED